MNSHFLKKASPSITGLDTASLELRQFAMVGAEFGSSEFGLSQNDNNIFRHIISTVAISWRAEELIPDAKERMIHVINRHESHGGRDFLFEEFKGQNQVDVIALCNIPEEAQDKIEFAEMAAQRRGSERMWMAEDFARIQNSFGCSEKHNDKAAWRAQIKASGAKMVFVYGADSFKGTDIIGDDYIEVPYALKCGSVEGIFIRQDYLEHCHDFLFMKAFQSQEKLPFAQWVDDVVMKALDAPKVPNSKAFTPA